MKKAKNKIRNIIYVLILIILVLICTALHFYYNSVPKDNNSNLIPIITVIISGLTVVTVSLFNYFFKLNDKYNGVRPIWKFTSFPFKFKFYTLDGNDSVADYIEYYLIYHINDNNWDIYKFNDIPNNSILDSNKEIDFKKIFSETYKIDLKVDSQQKENNSDDQKTKTTTAQTTRKPDSTLTSEPNDCSKDKEHFEVIAVTKDNIERIIRKIENENNFNEKVGVIISSTTIYGEKTYNIDGPVLKGALIPHKYNPFFYFGDYTCKSKKLAKELINKIDK